MEFSPSLSIAAMGGWSDGNVQSLPSGLATGTSKEPNFPIKTVSTQLSNNSCALRRNVRNMSFSFGASGGDSGSSSGMYSIAFAMLSRPSSAACFSDSSMLWSRDFNLLKFWPLKHQATIHCKITLSRMHQNAKLHRLWQKGNVQQTLYHLSYIVWTNNSCCCAAKYGQVGTCMFKQLVGRLHHIDDGLDMRRNLIEFSLQFFTLIWPAGSAPASLLFDPPEPQIIGKTQCFATFLPFRSSASSFFWSCLFWLFSPLLFNCPYCRKFHF